MTSSVLSACAFDCPDSCGLVATVEGGRLLDLRGREDHPYTRGFLCPKGSRWVRDLAAPDRLTVPLWRDGAGFRPLSWEEALDRLVRGVESALAHSGHLGVLWATGSGNLLLGNGILDRFPEALGGCTRVRGSLCGGEGGAALKESYALRAHLPPETVLASRRILLWGRNVAVTNPHFVPLLVEARRRGALVGSLDVRTTPTGRFAHRTWTVRPGSDGALARYLARRAFEARGFPDAPGEGGETFLSALRFVGEPEARGATGMGGEDLEDLARFVLDEGPLSLWAGWAVQRSLQGGETLRCLDALVFLLGSQGVPGGGLGFSADDEAAFPADLGRLPGTRPRWIPRPAPGPALLEADPPVEAALFLRANPLSQAQDAGALGRFLETCPFSACFDWRLSVTARACRLVLPVSPFPEQPGDFVLSYWHDLLQRTNPLVPSPVPSERELLLRLGARLGLPDPFTEAFGEMERRILATPGLEPLGEGIWRFPHPREHQGPFRFPHLTEAVPAPEGPPGLPWRLVTPHRFGSVNGNDLAQARPRTGRLAAWVGPAALASRGWKEGDEVVLSARGARLEALLALDPVLPEGVVVVESGVEGLNALIPPALTDRGNNRLSDAWVQVERG